MNKVIKMTEKKDADVIDNAEKPLPAFVKAAPELLPLWDWWVKNRKSMIVTLVVVALCVMGFFGVRSYLSSRNAKASKAFSVSNNPEELASAVAEYGSSKGGVGLKLRLAKNYFDNDQFDKALEVYEAVAKDVAKDNPFFDIANLGWAYSLEGLKRYQEAQDVFSAYASDEAKSHDGYRLTAQFGVARCMAQQQKNAAEAETYLKGLKDAATDEAKKVQYDSMISLLKHYDFSREDASLLDQFTPLDATLEPEPNSSVIPVPPPAPAPVQQQPAPAAKPAQQQAAPQK